MFIDIWEAIKKGLSNPEKLNEAINSFANNFFGAIASALGRAMETIRGLLPAWAGNFVFGPRDMIGPRLPESGPPSTARRGFAPGGGINQPFMPMNFRPGIDERPLTNALRQAVVNQQPRGPSIIHTQLNIDGKKISEAVDAGLAFRMSVPSQAPYHDSFAGWASPDQQFAAT